MSTILIKYNFLYLNILILFFSYTLDAQTKDYRTAINKAELAFKKENYTDALEAYKAAFRKKSEYNYFNLLKATKCAVALNKNRQAYKFIVKAIKSGCKLTRLEENEFYGINELYQKKLITHYPKLRKRYVEALEFETIIELERMDILDQFVRIEEIFFDSVGIITWLKVDSTNIEKLTHLTKKGGWLSPKRVGFDVSIIAFSILLHGTSDEINDKEQIDFFRPYLLAAIKNGEESPLRYATLIDRYRLWFEDKKQLYGSFNSNKEFNAIENIKEVDMRRKNLGLESLKDYAFKNDLSTPEGYN